MEAITNQETPDRVLFHRKRILSDVYSQLQTEAIDLRAISRRVASPICTLQPHGAVNGRGSGNVIGPGPILQSFHMGEGLNIARLFAGSDNELFPTRSAYLYYSPGDYTFFHHDNPNAHITVILGLSGTLLPLIVYPEFGAASLLDVDLLNKIANLDTESLSQEMTLKFGKRSLSREIEIVEQCAIAIRGRRVPHARARQAVSGTVCTACYAFLSPKREWSI